MTFCPNGVQASHPRCGLNGADRSDQRLHSESYRGLPSLISTTISRLTFDIIPRASTYVY